MKTDARVRYTKKVIRDSLFEILNHKSINNVTVKEVCERAELNRATFYKHYRDCYDLINQLEEEQLEEFRELFRKNEKFGKKLTGEILKMLKKYEDLNTAVVNGKVSDGLKNNMIEIARDFCMEEWKKAMPKATEEEVDMLFTAVCAAIFQVALCESGKYSDEKIINFTHMLLSNAMKHFR